METERWVVIDKPAGWLSIPGRNRAPVILEWVREIYPQIYTVHRLDIQTSGLILFARTADAHRLANGWFEKHEVKKAYDFLASGKAPLPVSKTKEPIAGLASATQFEMKEKFANAFLMRAFPMTGRRHQIRIHAAHLGFPILGDIEYGGAAQVGASKIQRVALHARSLELPSREKFEAPWPEDFSGWIKVFRTET